VQADGEWTENYSTLHSLASGSDIAAVVRIASAEAGRVIQGDAEEDVYCELNLNVEVADVLHANRMVEVSFVLPRAWSVADQARSVKRANTSPPIDDVVMFLRRRTDVPLYRAVNGWGVWAETSRDSLDAPPESGTRRSRWTLR
jgi:hypothetical protein